MPQIPHIPSFVFIYFIGVSADFLIVPIQNVGNETNDVVFLGICGECVYQMIAIS